MFSLENSIDYITAVSYTHLLEQDGEEIPEPTQIQNITLEKNQVPAVIEAVSYTHLDVYKRQIISS